MKKFGKKIIALAAAALMALSLGTAVSAAPSTGATGTITISNPVEGTDYKAYQIFQVAYDDNDGTDDNYNYTISTDSAWYDTVVAYAADTNHGLTLRDAAGDGTTKTIVTTSSFRASDFAAALKTALDGGSITDAGYSFNDNGVATNLPLGYYFVNPTVGTLCSLTTTTPSATVYDKNEVHFNKEVDDPEVEIGQTVNYTISGKVPPAGTINGYTYYDYTVKDTMSDGLTFNADSIVVKFGTETMSLTKVDASATLADGQYKITNNGFELYFNMNNHQDHVNDAITITYSAVVNENAIIGSEGNPNDAELVYSNNPSNPTDHDTIEIEQKVYTCKIIVDKYDAKDETKKLSGAKFVLTKDVDGTTYYYFYNTTTNKVEWYALAANETIAQAVNAGKITEVTTDANGAANFTGLEKGTYALVETASPTGYNLLENPVTVNANHDATEGTVNVGVVAKVANSSGTVLPTTGGMGTTVFYVVGAVLVVAAVVVLITRKRVSSNR